MSYDEYWNGPAWLARVYRENYILRKRDEEWARWRQGIYIFNALLAVAPVIRPFTKDAKPGKYLDEPLPITKKEAREREEARERAGYEKALARRRAESKLAQEQEAEKQEGIENG